MGKQVKLDTNEKKKAETAALLKRNKALRKTGTALRVVEMVIVTIFAMFMGIFSPMCIWFGTADPNLAVDKTSLIWFASSIVYIIGFFAVMLDASKVGAILDVIASVGTFMTYSGYQKFAADFPDSPRPEVGYYMPCLAITLLSIAVMIIDNIPKWQEKQKKKDEEKAPSILD